MSHSLAVQEDTSVLQKDIKTKTNGSGLDWRRGTVNPAVCVPPLQWNELMVMCSRQVSVQSVEREVHTAGLPMYKDGLRHGHGLFF